MRRTLPDALAGLRRPELHAVSLASYRRERLTELSLPIGAALMEGGFIGVLADKIFHVHPALLALVTAVPMFANLSSVAWARLAQRRPTVRFLVALLAGRVACLASIALLPTGATGGWLLAAVLGAYHLLLSGVITVRSLVWTRNYPRDARGRVTARLNVIATLAMTATSVATSFWLDASPESFRFVFAAGAVVALFGVVAYAGVQLLGDEEPAAAPLPRVRGVGIVSVLRADPAFARYLGWQFLLGASNMMIEAPLIYLVSRELDASYAQSIALTQAIPLGLSVVTLPLWAAWLDRVHILEFRAGSSWLWALSQALTWAGALAGSLLAVAAGRVLLGLARGGGSLAWNLGHNDFATPQSVGLYMGVHVTLTGLRGLIAPFLGMLLYVGWSPLALPVGATLPGFDGIGAHVFLVAALLSVTATLGFNTLARQLPSASG